MELLAARGITKFFPETETRANDRVSLTLAEGETRAVIGENGAGKSTLARIIAGMIAPDSGELFMRGARLRMGSVRAAEAAGIGFVPQVSLMANDLTVAENLILGREPRRLGVFLSRRRAYVEAALLFERYGFSLDPEARVADLTAAERRQAEIARAISLGGEVLILDEPTSILSEGESERVFELLSSLTDAGKAVLLITHRVSEVLRVADTITLLRNGAVVAQGRARDFDEIRLAGLMARRTARSGRGSIEAAEGSMPDMAAENAERPTALELRELVLARGSAPQSFAVKAGEVLGVAALAGNGLGKLEDYASGFMQPETGDVLVLGTSVSSMNRGVLRSRLLAYVPADREARGICLRAPMRDSVLALKRAEFKARDWIRIRSRNETARTMARRFGLESEPGAFVSSLSGGNRQRLVLARELDSPRAAVVLAEPLQGLDIASQEEVALAIRGLASRGSAVLLLSSRAEEILGIADRVVALYRGKIAYEGRNEGAATGRRLLAAMTGGSGSLA